MISLAHLRLRSMWTKRLARECLAEFIGTFFLVQFGTGAVMNAVFTGGLLGTFQIAAVWFIGLTLGICCAASISGAHLNPAISLAFALLRPTDKFSWNKVIPYIIAQLAGSVFASWVNLLMFHSQIQAFEMKNNIDRGSRNSIMAAKGFGEYHVAPFDTPAAFLAEAFGTAVLAFVIFCLSHPGNDTMKNSVYIPPFIGLCVAGLFSVLAPISQAGFNPARDFGPRIVAWSFGYKRVAFLGWWLYIVAPIIGAPLGAFLADRVLYAEEAESETVTAPHNDDDSTAKRTDENNGSRVPEGVTEEEDEEGKPY